MAIWANGYCDPAEKGCGFRSPSGVDLPKYTCQECGRSCCPRCGKAAHPDVPAEVRLCDGCLAKKVAESRAKAS